MAEPAFSVCVYCGSRPGENPAFAEAATAVGTWIGRHGGQHRAQCGAEQSHVQRQKKTIDQPTVVDQSLVPAP